MSNDEKSLEMYDFIEQCKDNHLTINDILDLSAGDKLDVVIWDRNFEEYWIWNKAKSNKPYDPQIFFGPNRWTIIYKGDMEWTIISEAGEGESFDHPVHLNTEHLNTYMIWVGLENDGMVHIEYEIIKEGNKIPKGWIETHIHWKDFPKTTRVGWRGPIMLWKKLEKLAKVYYKKGYYPEESTKETKKKSTMARNKSRKRKGRKKRRSKSRSRKGVKKTKSKRSSKSKSKKKTTNKKTNQ